MKKVLIEIIDDNMTTYEKVKAIHDWLIMNVTYDADLLNLVYIGGTTSAYNGFYLEGVFDDKKAVCEGISKAFACMANIEGIPCVVVEGYQTQNPTGAGHAWNKIKIDGKWYIIDATSDGVIIGNQFEVLSYKFFLISEEEMKEKYTGTKFENILCNSNYDYYKNFNFMFEEKEYDYAIESYDELKTIIKYFNSVEQENLTIEFSVKFDCGDSVVDEISNAYTELGINKGFSYTGSLTNFSIIK
jgi:hypothetical protein